VAQNELNVSIVHSTPRPVKAASALLLAYGVAALYVAVFENDLGHGDRLTTGFGLVPWFGLSAIGAAAALTCLVSARQSRTLLAVSAISLAAWTAYLLLGTNQGIVEQATL